MRRLSTFIALITLLLAISPQRLEAARYNRKITITAGTPIRLSTTKTIVTRVFIQMAISGTSAGYVMAGIMNGRTPASSASGDLTAQLAGASASAPGGSYSDADPAGSIDLSEIWVDGANSGDTVIVSYDIRN